MVGNKMLCVLNPRKANIQTLKNWDLWGPLVLCLTLATLLSWFAPYNQKSLVFASVFVIICCGATVRAAWPPGQMQHRKGGFAGVPSPRRCMPQRCFRTCTGGDRKCAASGWEHILLPVGMRPRILYLPAQHCERHLLARRAHRLASDCGRGVLLLVHLGLSRSVLPHASCARPPCAAPSPRRSGLPPLPQGSWGSLFRPTAGRWPFTRCSCFIRASDGSSSSPHAHQHQCRQCRLHRLAEARCAAEQSSTI